MEYILLTIFMLICGACVLAVFLEAEALDRKIIYEKGKFLKITKYRNGEKVSEKVFTGRKADFIYRNFKFGGVVDE